MRSGPRSEPTLVVELFGWPGAGKSTVLRLARQEAEGHGWTMLHEAQPVAPLRKLRSVLGLALRRPSDAWALLDWVAECRPTGAVDFLRSGFNLCWIVAEFAAARQRGVRLLADQGLLQALWSAAFFSSAPCQPPPRVWRAIHAALPDAVLVLDVPLDEALRRVAGRDKRRERFAIAAERGLAETRIAAVTRVVAEIEAGLAARSVRLVRLRATAAGDAARSLRELLAG